MVTKTEDKNIKKPVFKKTEKVLDKKTTTVKKEEIKKEEKLTIKKPINKEIFEKKIINSFEKNQIKKPIEKKVEIKEVSINQVKMVKKNNEAKALDKLDRAYATGKRKNAIAKVWLKKGSGKFSINGKPAIDYLQRPILEVIVNVPFGVTDTEDKFDIICTVKGGGLSGQAGAIKHGISKALLIFNSEAFKGELKKAGLLTRDSRVVERKKPGLKKARKGQVFSRR